MIDYVIIGKRVRSARLEKNLSQTELARLLGLSVGYICQIEGGDKCFNLKRLEEVAKVLEKPIGYFIGGADADFRTSTIGEIIMILNKFSKDDLDKVKKMLSIIIE